MRCGNMWQFKILLSFSIFELLVFVSVFNLGNTNRHGPGTPKPKPRQGPDYIGSEGPSDSEYGKELKEQVKSSGESSIGEIQSSDTDIKTGVGEAMFTETDTETDTDEFMSLKAGDVFTPHDLLPVTKILFKASDLPATVGKGIVSGSKSPEDLADKIFSGYFITTKRIVILRDEDISGLDALQKLAMEEDPDLASKYIVRNATAPKIVIRNPDKALKALLPPKKSRYNLLGKKKSKAQTKAELEKEKEMRRNAVLQLEKKLSKNRKLIINPKVGKLKDARRMQTFRKALAETNCTWRYECMDPEDANSCRLKAECMSDKSSGEEIAGQAHDSDYTINSKQKQIFVSDEFRLHTGMAEIDEKVEKIIEAHYLIVRPESAKRDPRIEGVDEYFNKLVRAQQSGTTPVVPKTTSEDELLKYRSDCDDNGRSGSLNKRC